MLAYRRFSQTEAPRYRAFLFHGILGSKKNIVTLARELAQLHQEWAFFAFDVRNHGDSHQLPGADDLANCAQDIKRANEHLGPVNMLIGHSFSGKVVLEYARKYANPELNTVWILDSIPLGITDSQDLERSDFVLPQFMPLVAQVFATLETLPAPFPSRAWLVDQLSAAGIPAAISAWITTCVKSAPGGGLEWAFDIEHIRPMLNSYAVADYEDYLSNSNSDLHFNFVQGAQSSRWTPAVLERMAAITQHNRHVKLEVLEKAGHFVHTDNLLGLLGLMRSSFTPS